MTDEQRKERLNYHMYTTCETPAEHAERIVKLEELCADMWRLLYHWLFKAKEVPYDELKVVADRMDELGIRLDH